MEKQPTKPAPEFTQNPKWDYKALGFPKKEASKKKESRKLICLNPCINIHAADMFSCPLKGFCAKQQKQTSIKEFHQMFSL